MSLQKEFIQLSKISKSFVFVSSKIADWLSVPLFSSIPHQSTILKPLNKLFLKLKSVHLKRSAASRSSSRELTISTVYGILNYLCILLLSVKRATNKDKGPEILWPFKQIHQFLNFFSVVKHSIIYLVRTSIHWC